MPNYYRVEPHSGSIFLLPSEKITRDNPEDKTITVSYPDSIRRFKREGLSLTLEDAKCRSEAILRCRIQWAEQKTENLELALSDVQNLTDDTLGAGFLVND